MFWGFLFNISKSHDLMGSFCWNNCGTHNRRAGNKYRSGVTMEQMDQSAILWGHISELFEYFLAHLFSVSLNYTTDLEVSVEG